MFRQTTALHKGTQAPHLFQWGGPRLQKELKLVQLLLKVYFLQFKAAGEKKSSLKEKEVRARLKMKRPEL